MERIMQLKDFGKSLKGRRNHGGKRWKGKHFSEHTRTAVAWPERLDVHLLCTGPGLERATEEG